MLYNPNNWYWLSDDGRLFSSALSSIVPLTNATYLAWIAQGHTATRWPSDNAGVQTSAALQDVLTPYNLFCDLISYAQNLRWVTEVGGIVFSGIPIATDDRSKLMITGARVAANADPTWTTMWQGADNNSYPVNATAMIAISDAVQNHVASCFEIYATVAAAIEAGTVTTHTQIDTAFKAAQ